MGRTRFLRDTAGLKELRQTDDGNRIFLKAGRTRY
ncbi:histidine kinase [Heyndrickxia coagulans]|nr:histidine kinase [Heyndrickxia coagulans]